MLSTISTPGAMFLAHDTSFALSIHRQGKYLGIYLGMYVHNWFLIRSGPHYLEGYCTLFNCCCVMRPHGLLLLLQASSSSIFLSCAPAYCGTDRSGERILSHLWEHVSMFPLLGIASAANHRNECFLAYSISPLWFITRRWVQLTILIMCLRLTFKTCHLVRYGHVLRDG